MFFCNVSTYFCWLYDWLFSVLQVFLIVQHQHILFMVFFNCSCSCCCSCFYFKLFLLLLMLQPAVIILAMGKITRNIHPLWKKNLKSGYFVFMKNAEKRSIFYRDSYTQLLTAILCVKGCFVVLFFGYSRRPDTLATLNFKVTLVSFWLLRMSRCSNVWMALRAEKVHYCRYFTLAPCLCWSVFPLFLILTLWCNFQK